MTEPAKQPLPDVDLTVSPEVTSFLDPVTGTISYIVKDPATDACAVIDAVMEFDVVAGRLAFDLAQSMVDYITAHAYRLEWIIETHVHADHLSAAPWIQQKLGGKIGIGAGIREVQELFGKVFNEGTDFQRDGSQFDQLFNDGDTWQLGAITATAIHTPGHTPACMTHLLGDSAFVGDTLFMPDTGTGRADFPGGDARTLYHSMRRILSLPEETRVFMCHDYGNDSRDVAYESTVGEQRRSNVHIHDGVTEDEFVALREEKDRKLSLPRLIIPSLQVNMRAGEVPEDASGNPVIKIPVNAFN